MQQNQAIFEKLFSRSYSGPGNIDYLKSIAEAYPFFSPAQFYLLQQTKKGTTQYDEQANRTNILFNNPLWLNFQLQQTNAVEIDIKPVEKVTAAADFEEPIAPPAVSEENANEFIPSPVTETAVSNEALNEAAPPVEIFNEQPDDTELANEADMEREIAPMKIELKIPEQKANLSEAMLFEPMHIVDYFASQGIKLTDDVQPGDKLGKQLKSFTEWLKTMKKVHVETDTDIIVETGHHIQTLAENSNANAEVLTESMAEVFAKQGKLDKAGEVYQKLSLLNPAKSAYFAAKIENLKEI